MPGRRDAALRELLETGRAIARAASGAGKGAGRDGGTEVCFMFLQTDWTVCRA